MFSTKSYLPSSDSPHLIQYEGLVVAHVVEGYPGVLGVPIIVLGLHLVQTDKARLRHLPILHGHII